MAHPRSAAGCFPSGTARSRTFRSDHAAAPYRNCAMSRSAKARLAAGWLGFALLPWHALGWGEWLAGLSSGGSRSAAALMLAGQAWWLAPVALALLLATVPLFGAARGQHGQILSAAGLAGLALIASQGFAIGQDGWNWAFLGNLFGAPGPAQPGMGF